MSGTAIFWIVVGGLVLTFWAYSLWSEPRERRKKEEKQALRVVEDRAREIQRAESKQRRLDEEFRIGQLEWEKKIADTGDRLQRSGSSGVFRCKGRELCKLLDWQQLEEMVACLLEEDGWESELTGSGPDVGVDIKCKRSKTDGTTESLVVQVKHFASGSIGAPVVRQILGAAVHEGASGALVVTSARFAKGVESEFSKSVGLWDGDILFGRIDSLTDAQFERMAQPYKLALGRHALAEKERLEQEEARLESERDAQRRNELICESQLNVLKRMEEADESWPKCSRCGNSMAVKLGRTYFWGCKSYPSCRGTRNVPTQ